jgi:hypothetical protein
MPYHIIVKFLGKDDRELICQEFDSEKESATMAIDAKLIRLESNARRAGKRWNKVVIIAEKTDA